MDFIEDLLDASRGDVVVDLGAGTGRISRWLMTTAATPVAVEPVDEMRQFLQTKLPGVRAISGRAEAMPLGDASAQGVVAAQCFHWFDGERALEEIARVLHPAAPVVALWNIRSLDSPRIARLEAMLGDIVGAKPRFQTGRWRDAFSTTRQFDELSHRRFEFSINYTGRGFLQTLGTISTLARMEPAERDDVLEKIRMEMGISPGEVVEIPHRTELFWCRRVADGPRT